MFAHEYSFAHAFSTEDSQLDSTLYETVDRTLEGEFRMESKKMYFPNGDLYNITRIYSNSSTLRTKEIMIEILGKQGSFRYIKHHSVKEWDTVPLEHTLPEGTGFVETDLKHYLVSAPRVYKQGAYHTLEDVGQTVPVRIAETEDGYFLQISFPLRKDRFGEIWYLESSHPLMDWSNQTLEKVWLALDMDVSQRWSWDGFYVITPATYSPSGKNIFWRIPDNYLARSFILTGGSRAAEDLGWMMLRTIVPNQNAFGFWETSPRSEWLWKEYRIPHGFYDTRFNTDIAYLLLKGYQKYNDELLYDSNKKYADFLLSHIEKNHFVIKGKERDGWLVQDYSSSNPNAKPTHSSLNHQLQEINYLLEMYLHTEDMAYRDYAEKLLYGIKNSKSKWIMPNHNLEYAYLPNGKMGYVDYPFLTYNDLYETQRLLKKIYGSLDPDLQELMDHKKRWMDANQITGYKK